MKNSEITKGEIKIDVEKLMTGILSFRLMNYVGLRYKRKIPIDQKNKVVNL